MLRGAVNRELEAIVRVDVHGQRAKSQAIDAVIDTGFNGSMTLPPSVIAALKLPWMFRQQGELADGSVHVFDVHAAEVLWDGEMRTVEVEAADTDPLIGMALLTNQELRIEVAAGGNVSIRPLP